MYKFWKEADPKDRVYVSMYSSFDDAGDGCILQCGGGDNGGKSAWGTGIQTSSQYEGGAGAIDSGYWYSQADSNSVQDVKDYLNNGGSVYLLRGQWKNLGTGDAFGTFKDIGKKKYNVRLFLAQTTQITKNCDKDTVITRVDKEGNPDNTIDSQRNHSKYYVSKNSIASCSGHPYNGGVQDWGGINEVLLVEHCPNACIPVRSNWELEYTHGEKLENAATFPWAQQGWSGQQDNGDPTTTKISSAPWKSGDTKGAVLHTGY